MKRDGSAAPAVLLGGSLTALSLTRGLGRRGIPVHALHDGRSNSLVGHSRSCSQDVYFQPEDIQQNWLGWLLHDAEEPSVVLACCDDGLELIARHRAELESVGHMPMEADDAVVLAMLSKDETYRLAREIGVPAPQTAIVSDPEGLALEAAKMPYPCAVKPEQPNLFLAATECRPDLEMRATAKGRRLETIEEAMSVLGPLMDLGVPMILTEIVEGPDDSFCSYYTYVDHTGDALVHFTKRKLRQYPVRFGGGTYHKTEWLPEVAEMGLKFFEGVGLRGVGNIEFKRDSRDGVLKIIECNPRFTASDNLIRAAGVDLGYMAYQRALGHEVSAPARSTPSPHFAENKWQWLPVDDFKAMLAYRQAGELAVGAWARTLLHPQHFPVFDASDPLPFASAIKRAAKRGATGIGRDAVGWGRARLQNASHG